jgi:hypothetical protein
VAWLEVERSLSERLVAGCNDGIAVNEVTLQLDGQTFEIVALDGMPIA